MPSLPANWPQTGLVYHIGPCDCHFDLDAAETVLSPINLARAPRTALTLLAPLLVLGVARPAGAGLEIAAEVGFDAHYMPGEWTPLEVILSNMPADTDARPPVDLVGQLSVVSRSYHGRPFLYTTEVDLPANSRKRLWLVIKIAAPQGNMLPAIDVEFRATNRRGRATVSVQGQPIPAGSQLALVVREPGNPEGIMLPGISGSQSWTVASVSRLPDQWPALSSVAAIFLTRSAALNLGATEIAALQTWVARGGVLVVDGGGGASLGEAPIASLLPVETGERSTWQISAGGVFQPLPEGTDPLPAGSVVLLQARARPDSVVLWSQGPERVFAAERSLGLGRVAFVAWDLASQTMSQNSRATAALAGLLPSASSILNHDVFHQLILENIAPDPRISTPSVLLVFVLLLGYWVVVGPGNYLWLTRQKKIEWSWVTIPLLIAAFCGLFYAIGYVTNSNRDSLRHINVAFAQPGVPVARAEAISLYFSAGRQRVDFAPARADSTLSQISFWDSPQVTLPMMPQTFGRVGRRLFPQPGFGIQATAIEAMSDVRDPTSVVLTREGMVLRDQLVNQWSFAYLESSGPADLGGTVEARAWYVLDATGAEFRLRGEVTNRTGVALRHCAVLWGDRACPLSPDVIGPGETATFTAPWFPLEHGQGFQSRAVYEQQIDQEDPTHIRRASLRASLLEDVMVPWLNPRTGTLRLVAFTDKALLEPRPDRPVERLEDVTLILLEVPLEVLGPTRFTLPGECLPRTHTVHAATDDSVLINTDISLAPVLQLRDTDVLLNCRLPFSPTVEARIESLQVALSFQDSDNQQIHLYALDRSGASADPWIRVPIHQGEHLGAEVGLPIQAPQRLDAARVVDPLTGEITLRIEAAARASTNPMAMFATVNSIDLRVEGWARPRAAAPPAIPAEEPRP